MVTTDPLAAYARSVRVTPQNAPIPGRETEQVRGVGGGYGFAVDDWTRLHRFLILGTDGGTYYADEQKLTVDSASAVLRCLATDGLRVVDHIRTLSLSGDAPKQGPVLFALALACASPDDVTSHAAFAAVPDVCRTGTMLFQWNGYLSELRGWGPRRKRAVAAWYNRPVTDVGYQTVKYRQRNGWSHRDLLRLAHPAPITPQHSALFQWITGKGPTGNPVRIVEAYEQVQDPSLTVPQVCALIEDANLPWEALPDRLLSEQAVWQTLLPRLGATALLRQLPRLTRLGVIAPYGKLPERVRQLADVEFLRRGRIHPVAVLNALYGYKSGVARSGGQHVVVPHVVALLDESFHASFGTIVPSGKRTLIAVDVSDSMTWPESQLKSLPALNAREAAAAMAMATVRSEEDVLVTAFSSGITQLGEITRRSTITETVATIARQYASATDCALPMLWAESKRIFDVEQFVIYTDNETNIGHTHPTQALRSYRAKSGSSARLAVCGMTSTGFTVADPADAGQLDLVGMDAATPHILSAFASGDL